MTTIQNALEEIADLFAEILDAEWDWNYHSTKKEEADLEYSRDYHFEEADKAWDRGYEAKKKLKTHGVDLWKADFRMIEKRREERKAKA